MPGRMPHTSLAVASVRRLAHIGRESAGAAARNWKHARSLHATSDARGGSALSLRNGSLQCHYVTAAVTFAYIRRRTSKTRRPETTKTSFEQKENHRHFMLQKILGDITHSTRQLTAMLSQPRRLRGRQDYAAPRQILRTRRSRTFLKATGVLCIPSKASHGSSSFRDLPETL